MKVLEGEAAGGVQESVQREVLNEGRDCARDTSEQGPPPYHVLGLTPTDRKLRRSNMLPFLRKG
jgi:hypothetical protein